MVSNRVPQGCYERLPATNEEGANCRGGSKVERHMHIPEKEKEHEPSKRRKICDRAPTMAEVQSGIDPL